MEDAETTDPESCAERKVITDVGYLSVDNKTLYQMNDFTVRIARS